MEVEAPESTRKVTGCSFTLVAIYHPACFWIVRTCSGLSELQAGTMASCPAHYLFNGAAVWLSFCKLSFTLFSFTSPLLLEQFLTICPNWEHVQQVISLLYFLWGSCLVFPPAWVTKWDTVLFTSARMLPKKVVYLLKQVINFVNLLHQVTNVPVRLYFLNCSYLLWFMQMRAFHWLGYSLIFCCPTDSLVHTCGMSKAHMAAHFKVYKSLKKLINYQLFSGFMFDLRESSNG